MQNILKKSLQLGLAVYAKTQKEIESIVNELVRNKKLNQKEGEKLLNEALLQSKKIEAKLEKEVKKGLLQAIKKFKTMAQQDLVKLEKKLKSRR